MKIYTMYLLLERFFFHLADTKLNKAVRKEIQKLDR